jgi:hypothetical protein
MRALEALVEQEDKPMDVTGMRVREAGISMGSKVSHLEPELARRPRVAASPRPELRPMLPRGYSGFTDATEPTHLVLPATVSVPLIVKILDSPYRPPAFVMGVHGGYSAPDGDCAPSYLEVWLAPLAAYKLLGLPMDELSGQTVDMTDILGAAGRRFGEQLREAPTWSQRFALLDEFLLQRLEGGPRPSPEVAGHGSDWSQPPVLLRSPGLRTRWAGATSI